MTRKKLAAELEHDPKVTAIQIVDNSDDEAEYVDAEFDLQSVKADYTAKKANLDDIKKNKYAPLQIASIRKFWEKEMCGNEEVMQAIGKKYSVRAYFPFSGLNKFGALIASGEKEFIVKFVSVGSPEKILDSILIDYEATAVYSRDLRVIVVGETEANLYDLEAKDNILKTHRHESSIVYAGFPKLDVDSILTVTKTGIARLFDVANRAFYWMCMTDAEASHHFVREDKLYYSVGSELLSVSLKTKEMASVHKYAQRI